MHDGVRLHTALYMPLSPGPYPTVLTRVPYDITAPDVFVSAVAPAFLDAGFAFVAQDTRGKARSEGDLTLFAHEATDGANTLDWITDQSWSSGDVFMWGESYSGSMTR
jgi:putative CocE/NonD family hydrolase